MTDMTVTEKLELRWVRVVDEQGRTHLEARWSVAGTVPAAPAHVTHAA